MIQKARVERVGYIDFYCGPGRFDDGSKSTPLLLLEQVIASPVLRSRLITTFNDENPIFTARLQYEIDQLPGVETLRFKPQIIQHPVDDYYAEYFAGRRTIPLLSFLDPWGYKGLTRQLIESLVKDFGSEAIFFFNYSRINAAITNNLVEPHIQAIFGEERLARLRSRLPSYDPSARESILMRELGEVFEEIGARFLIPFRFQREHGRSHYICFVSKHPRGYSIMKDIMAGLGIKDADGVPRFEYLPARDAVQLGFDLDIDRPILKLPQSLMSRFRGRTISVGQIVDEHNVGTPFVKPNYKRVLIEMELSRVVTCDRSAAERRPGTIADTVLVSFPA